MRRPDPRKIVGGATGPSASFPITEEIDESSLALLKAGWNAGDERVSVDGSHSRPKLAPFPRPNATPTTAELGTFDRLTPVSYRVDTELMTGSTAEVWGYFQVREHEDRHPLPYSLPPDLIVQNDDHKPSRTTFDPLPEHEIDLLALTDPSKRWSVGEWTKSENKLVSPKQYGARLELPYSPPEEYRLVVILEPLDEPNGLILGNRSGEHRFVTLFHYTPGQVGLSAIENIDGQNVGNESTFEGDLFRKNRVSQVIVTVQKRRVTMAVDGRRIADWSGTPDRLSLSDYWTTPDNQALFLGAYDCRYRFHRISVEPITGTGKVLAEVPADGN